MKMSDYLWYAAPILLGFVAWAFILSTMSKSKEKSKDIKGVLLVGPAHLILKRRDYKLSRREVIGWGVVLLFMLAAPLITYWLEN